MTAGMLGHAVPMFHDSIAESSKCYTHACTFFNYVNCNWCFWLRAHVMCSTSLVSKPQGDRGQNQLTLYISTIPLSSVESLCHVLYGPGVETT